MLTKSISFTQIKAREVILIFSLALGLALAAQVKIPLFFTPVPLTLQTFIVYLAIKTLGKKAALPVLLYLAAGVFGLPVFAATSFGLAYLTGVTGGYLLGFLLAALLVPFFSPKARTFFKNIVCFLSAALIIYGLGILWLIFLFKLSLPAALLTGLYPFLAGEALKIIIAAFVTSK